MSQMSFETFGPVVSSYIHRSLCGISKLLVIANKVTYHSTETTGRHEESNTRNVSKSGLKHTWSFILNMCSMCMNSFQIDLLYVENAPMDDQFQAKLSFIFFLAAIQFATLTVICHTNLCWLNVDHGCFWTCTCISGQFNLKMNFVSCWFHSCSSNMSS